MTDAIEGWRREVAPEPNFVGVAVRDLICESGLGDWAFNDGEMARWIPALVGVGLLPMNPGVEAREFGPSSLGGSSREYSERDAVRVESTLLPMVDVELDCETDA